MFTTIGKGLIAAVALSVLLGTTAPGIAGAATGHWAHHGRFEHARHRGHFLTDEQKQCLVDQGVALPSVPPALPTAGDHHWTRPDAATIAAFRAALVACGITFPWHDHHVPPTVPPTVPTTTTSTTTDTLPEILPG